MINTRKARFVSISRGAWIQGGWSSIIIRTSITQRKISIPKNDCLTALSSLKSSNKVPIKWNLSLKASRASCSRACWYFPKIQQWKNTSKIPTARKITAVLRLSRAEGELDFVVLASRRKKKMTSSRLEYIWMMKKLAAVCLMLLNATWMICSLDWFLVRYCITLMMKMQSKLMNIVMIVCQ